MRRRQRNESNTHDARGAEHFRAPSDCTHGAELSRLASRIVMSLRRRPEMVVLDLSEVRTMNSLLLSTVVYVARECCSAGVRLQLDGVRPLFRDWASTHGLLRHLDGRGLVSAPDSFPDSAGESP